MSKIPTELDPLSIGGKNPFHGYVTDGLELLVDIEDATADAEGKLQLWDIVSGQAMTMTTPPPFEERYEVRKIIFTIPEYADNANRQAELVTAGYLCLSPYIQYSGYSAGAYFFIDGVYIPRYTSYQVGKKRKFSYPVGFDIDKLNSFSLSPLSPSAKAYISAVQLMEFSDTGGNLTANGLFNQRAYTPDGPTQNVRFRTLRVYSRELTEEEIRHNYEVDKKRFNLT